MDILIKYINKSVCNYYKKKNKCINIIDAKQINFYYLLL